VTIAPRLRQQQQIKFVEGTALTRFTTTVESLQFENIGVLVLFKVTPNYFIFEIPASGTDFQNTGLLPASAKLAVKYRPDR